MGDLVPPASVGHAVTIIAREIARHLVEQHGIDGWWAQRVAHDRVDPAKAALIALLEAAKTR